MQSRPDDGSYHDTSSFPPRDFGDAQLGSILIDDSSEIKSTGSLSLDAALREYEIEFGHETPDQVRERVRNSGDPSTLLPKTIRERLSRDLSNNERVRREAEGSAGEHHLG